MAKRQVTIKSIKAKVGRKIMQVNVKNDAGKRICGYCLIGALAGTPCGKAKERHDHAPTHKSRQEPSAATQGGYTKHPSWQ